MDSSEKKNKKNNNIILWIAKSFFLFWKKWSAKSFKSTFCYETQSFSKSINLSSVLFSFFVSAGVLFSSISWSTTKLFKTTFFFFCADYIFYSKIILYFIFLKVVSFQDRIQLSLRFQKKKKMIIHTYQQFKYIVTKKAKNSDFFIDHRQNYFSVRPLL